MLGAVLKAQKESWGKESVEEGARFARQVWDLLWDERHRVVRPAKMDPKMRPEIVGILVEMLAARAVKVGEGKDEGGEVRKYVERLLGLWKYAELEVDEADWNDANAKMLMWAPVWHGMELARQVLGQESQLGKELGERVDKDLEPFLNKARTIVAANAPENGVRRGLRMYEQLMLAGFS